MLSALFRDARVAARDLAKHARTNASKRRLFVTDLAERLLANEAWVLQANEMDQEEAKASGANAAFIDRLTLSTARIQSLAAGLRAIAELPDPLTKSEPAVTQPNGLLIERVRVPLGVIGIVYESRPNVTLECAALAVRAGNAILLRGGKEARHTNEVFADLLRHSLLHADLPIASASLLPTERSAILELIQATEYVDLVIPRGGESLIRFVAENARVPVVQHYKGVCHLYVDGEVKDEEARQIVINAKLSRPGVCNALEGLLVHESKHEWLKGTLAALFDQGCSVFGCDATRALDARVQAIGPDDYGVEYLDKILAVKVVKDLDEAMNHISRFGSGHSEAICTTNEAHRERFLEEVDAACVLANASTRFHDGGALGLGAEMGIATSRIHWRGPMGLDSLTTMKWVVRGEGQTRI